MTLQDCLNESGAIAENIKTKAECGQREEQKKKLGEMRSNNEA